MAFMSLNFGWTHAVKTGGDKNYSLLSTRKPQLTASSHDFHFCSSLVGPRRRWYQGKQEYERLCCGRIHSVFRVVCRRTFWVAVLCTTQSADSTFSVVTHRNIGNKRRGGFPTAHDASVL